MSLLVPSYNVLSLSCNRETQLEIDSALVEGFKSIENLIWPVQVKWEDRLSLYSNIEFSLYMKSWPL